MKQREEEKKYEEYPTGDNKENKSHSYNTK
jgi:hypothetical protein